MARGSDSGEQFSFDTEIRGTSPGPLLPPPPPVPDLPTVVLPAAGPPASVTPAESAIPVLAVNEAHPVAPRRFQSVAWVVLGLALTGALLNGLSAYAALASELGPSYLADVSDRLWGATIGVICAVIGTVLGGVAVIVSRPKMPAVVALAAALTLPTIGLVLGLKLGFGALVDHLGDEMVEIQDTLVALASGGNELADMAVTVIRFLLGG